MSYLARSNLQQQGYKAAFDRFPHERYETLSPSTMSTFLSTNSSAIAFNFFRTLFLLLGEKNFSQCETDLK